jgi:hypothetical protein
MHLLMLAAGRSSFMANSILSEELQKLLPGEHYTRSQLYEVFHVPANQRGGDWATGYHRHEDLWFIFATVAGPGRTGHDYENVWAENGSFVWHGKTGASRTHPSIQSLIDPGMTILLFTRAHDRDQFTFHGEAVPLEVRDTTPVTVVWQVRSKPNGTSPSVSGEGSRHRNPSEIPYLRNTATSEFYGQVKEVIEREMPLDPGNTIVCNLQKTGGYELAVEVIIKPGEEFVSNREYRDPTRFPARIRAAATALRDTGNFDLYSISHRASVLTINQRPDELAPTTDKAQLDRATKALLAGGDVREPAGWERPKRVEITQTAFARDPRVRAWVLANANGSCEACANQAPFFTDDGSPFLEVHHVKMLADGGSDQITNAVALCPNCHRRFHHAADREPFVTSIYQQVRRLVRQ